MIINQAQPYRPAVLALLASQSLPVDDLPENLDHFLVALQGKEVIGIVGVEIYGAYGLLRSLAVHPDHRGNKIGNKLLQRIEALSNLKGLTELYLLTETAPAYFDAHGYQKITRPDVPEEVQQSSEFSHVCPASAIVMKKKLK